MSDDAGTPLEWPGRQPVVAFPERVTQATAGQVSAQLEAAITDGVDVVIADMSKTTSCDQVGADLVLRAYRRALIHRVELRLVVVVPSVRQVLAADGLDRLVSVYPSLETALAAGTSAGQPAPPAAASLTRSSRSAEPWRSTHNGRPASEALNAMVLRQLIDALGDGIALTDEAGTIVLVNRQLAAMFGYQPGELVGETVEALVPAGLRALHRQYRAAYTHEPLTRLMSDRARLAGSCKDGTTVPVIITLSPVPTADRLFVLVVVRRPEPASRQEDLTDLIRAATAEHEERESNLLDRVVRGLFHVGLSLEAAVDQPADLARERIAEALRRLDDTIHEIRDHIFRTRERDGR